MSAKSLFEYEQGARKALLLAPGKRLTRINLELHQEDDAFWPALSAWLSSSSTDQDHATLASKESYLFSLVELSAKQPGLWVRLRDALDKGAFVLPVPSQQDMQLSKLNRVDGESGIGVWHTFFCHFKQHNDLTREELSQYLAYPDWEWLKDYDDSLGWLRTLSSKGVKVISDRALYIALAHGVSDSLSRGEDQPRWIKRLKKIPNAMLGHSSLGLLLALEQGQIWCERYAIAPMNTLLAPLGDYANGIGELFWSRNYLTYSSRLDEQLKRAYVQNIDPMVFIEKTLERGSMRISPSAMPIIAQHFAEHAASLRRIPLTEKQINDLGRIGVSSDVLASHPDVKGNTKSEMLRKDLDL